MTLNKLHQCLLVSTLAWLSIPTALTASVELEFGPKREPFGYGMAGVMDTADIPKCDTQTGTYKREANGNVNDPRFFCTWTNSSELTPPASSWPILEELQMHEVVLSNYDFILSLPRLKEFL